MKSNLERSLLTKGHSLHALTRNGLRIVRVDTDEDMICYGEHASIGGAMVLAGEDFRAGHGPIFWGRPSPTAPVELGDPSMMEDLESWMRFGHTFTAFYDRPEKQFVVQMNGVSPQITPREVSLRVQGGQTVRWESRGYLFETSPSVSRFTLGHTVTRMIQAIDPTRNGTDIWEYKITKKGEAPTLIDALLKAMTATAYEYRT